MSNRKGLLGPLARAALLACLAAAGCDKAPVQSRFPDPARPVSPIVSSRYLNEDVRDRVGEATTVMRVAGIRAGMWVADVGAGEGYYTVRLAPLVGARGRVLAQDVVPLTRDELARRVERERLDNVAVKLGQPNDPMLPPHSFDRVFLIHMYHEVRRPSEFLWHLRDSLKVDGRVVVVDADRPTDRHGTPPKLLVCEFASVGYELKRFEPLPDSESYIALFAAKGAKPAPEQIRVCAA